VQWSSEVKEVGDSFTITASSISFNEDKSVFYIIDESGESKTGTSVFCTNHPNSKFNSTPHGVRLANAIGRAAKLAGEVDVQDLVDFVNDAKQPFQVVVEKTDKGVLWLLE